MITQTIRKRAEKKFPDYLRAVFKQQLDTFFPLYIPFPKEKANAPLPKLEQWISELKSNSKDHKGFGYTLEMNLHKSRTNNFQTLPTKLYFSDETNYLKYIGKEKEAIRFQELTILVLQKVPALQEWILNKPLRFLKYAEKWDQILKVILYFQKNPRPFLYARELPIEVHSKFVESHKGLIEQLLRIVIPSSDIDWELPSTFERLSLKKAPAWIRMRFLDPDLAEAFGFPYSEVAIPSYSFKKIRSPKPTSVFIIENQINFLTFPLVKNGIAIWGKGYSAREIKGEWLKNSHLWYWGDLDAHGFNILSIFRGNNPQTMSFLMDTQTYERFQQYSVSAPPFKEAFPPNLTPSEKKMCLKFIKTHLRLEQEHIAQAWVRERLKALLSSSKYH